MSKTNVANGRCRFLIKTAASSMAAVLGVMGLGIGSANASARPKQLANITIGLSSSSLNDLPLWVGQSNGFFAAQGLSVKVPILSASTVTPALLSGSIQYLSSSATGYLQAEAASDPIVAFDADIYGFAFGVLFSTQFIAANGITTKTPMATIAKDMVGSTGGESAAANVGAMAVMLQSYGVNISQMNVALFSGAPAVEAAFGAGKISWFTMTEPVPFQYESQGLGQVLMSPKNIPAWESEKVGYNQVIEGTQAFVAANPGLTRKVAHAVQTTVQWIRAHQQKALNVAQANLTGVTRTILFNSIRLESWAPNGQMNGNKWRTTIAFDVKSGQIQHGFKVVENSSWTNKYL